MNKATIVEHFSEISPEMRKLLLTGVSGDVRDKASKLIDMEQQEEGVAYIQLLQLLLQSPDDTSLSQEVSALYDKIFYVADSIEYDKQGTLVVKVGSNGFVRLNDKVQLPGLPMVNDLRSRLQEGVLFSGVGAIQINTKDGVKIPLLQRDAGAPSDAGKYTLPAGRADKTPGLTAYEEVLEELVLFARKEGKLHQIVPFIQDGGISVEKAKQLTSIARGRYVNSILRDGTDISLQSLNEFISAEFTVVPLQITLGGTSVKTVFSNVLAIFSNVLDKNNREVVEDGFFPIHDEKFNTYEMVRGFHLDLQDFDEVIPGDGDGFGRNTCLFTLDEIKRMNIEKEAVASLQGAIGLGVFDKK